MTCSIIPFYQNPDDIYLKLPREKQGGKFAESKLYALLQKQLPDNWFVIYSLYFQGEHRPNEMDFLVLVPEKGIVYLECKGQGYTVTHGGNEFIFDKNRAQNFTLQERQGVIRNCANNIKEYFFPNEIYPPFFAYAVIFPTVNIAEDGSSTEDTIPKPFDFHGLHVYTKKDLYGETGNDSPLPRIINSLLDNVQNNRQTYFHDQEASKIFQYYEKKVKTTHELCDFDGDMFNRSLEDIYEGAAHRPCSFILAQGAYKCIYGAAGTGKTWIAIDSAKLFVEQFKKTHPNEQCRILYVCYNTLLAAEIANRNEDFKELTVANFHRLDQVCLNQTRNGGNNESFDEEARDKEIHDSLYNALQEKRLKKYDMILVDEAQDFNMCKLQTICLLAKSQNRKIVFFADQVQRIHQGENTNSIYEEVTGQHKIDSCTLEWVIRNSSNIHQYCALLIKDNMTSSIRKAGPEVEIFTNSNFQNIKKVLQDKLNSVPPSYIAILWDALYFKEEDIKSQFRDLNTNYGLLGKGDSFGHTKKNLMRWHSPGNERYIWAISLQKFKGLEVSYVLLLLKKGNTQPIPHYVGATRAKYKLFVFQME